MSLKEQLIDAIVDGDNLKVSNLVDGMDVSDVNERSEKRGMTALHAACEHENDAAMNILLSKSGIDVNVQNTWGATPLHIACEFGNDEAISKLLAVPGIAINVQDQNGFTPLHIACRKTNVQIISRLLATPGIDVNVKDIDGDTPVMIAAGFHREETFKLLLRDYRVDLDAFSPDEYLDRYGRSEDNQKYVDLIGEEVRKRNYTRICWSCSKTKMEVTLYKCSGCVTAKYCGKECIERDWPVHKNWCLKQLEKRRGKI